MDLTLLGEYDCEGMNEDDFISKIRYQLFDPQSNWAEAHNWSKKRSWSAYEFSEPIFKKSKEE